VIAVALSVLVMAQVDAPADVSAAEPPPAAELDEPDSKPAATSRSQGPEAERLREEPAGLGDRAPASTLPLRWRIPYARHTDGSAGFMDCVTAVSIHPVPGAASRIARPPVVFGCALECPRHGMLRSG